jgi:hypothetical protein
LLPFRCSDGVASPFCTCEQCPVQSITSLTSMQQSYVVVLVNMLILLMVNMPSITMGLGIAVRVYSSHCLFSRLIQIFLLFQIPMFHQKFVMQDSKRLNGCPLFHSDFALAALLHVTSRNHQATRCSGDCSCGKVPRSALERHFLVRAQTPCHSPERTARDVPQLVGYEN